jgi:lipopolysaccharide/colanic/teichoic acid biosynthesis glycosyltransferase
MPTWNKRPSPRRSALQPTYDPPYQNSYLPYKAVSDFVLAFLLLIPASVILVVIGVLVKLTSRGPVFYRQTRLGKDGIPFTLYKIRTMTHNCEVHSGVRWSHPGDPRVTLLGRLLRPSHLDELPQLWNVLKGDMSLVGPRPERPEFVPVLEKEIPEYPRRLAIRPGITGLAQVQLPPDTDLNSVRRKLAHDLHYLERLSLWLDVRILLCTVFKVLCMPMDISRRLLGLTGGKAILSSSAIRLSKAS